MITPEQIRQLEEEAETIGVSRQLLMDNAGRAVAGAVEDRFQEDIENKKILLLCGQGNNGGDGFVAARYLMDCANIKIFFIGDELKLPAEARVNYDMLRTVDADLVAQGKESIFIEMTDDVLPRLKFEEYDIVIDALIGIGCDGALVHPYSTLVRELNATKEPFVVSVDIPSGLDAIKGPQEGHVYVDADLIITFHDTKPGLKSFKKKTMIVPIGLP